MTLTPTLCWLRRLALLMAAWTVLKGEDCAPVLLSEPAFASTYRVVLWFSVTLACALARSPAVATIARMQRARKDFIFERVPRWVTVVGDVRGGGTRFPRLLQWRRKTQGARDTRSAPGRKAETCF